MTLRRLHMGLCFLFLLGISQGCTDEPAKTKIEPTENLENVKNESVIKTLNSIANDSVVEDVIANPEAKMKAEKLKAKRVDKLTQKVNASPFKGFSDDEIKSKLENELKKYRESCDTAVVNLIFDQMAYDAVLSIFKQREATYCRTYFKQIQNAKKDCKK